MIGKNRPGPHGQRPGVLDYMPVFCLLFREEISIFRQEKVPSFLYAVSVRNKKQEQEQRRTQDE
jgi:hypothetical protein